jgi:hypothetical protein
LQRFLTTMATYRYGNLDHRRQVTVTAPSNEELEARLRDLLSPGTFANLKTVTDYTRQLRDLCTDITSDGSNYPEFSLSLFYHSR